MNPPLDLVVGPLMQRMLDCLCARLASTVGGPVGRCCVALGQSTTADGCCPSQDCDESGQASVRLVSLFPTAPFPNVVANTTRCNQLEWGANLELAVYRCVHVIEEGGCPPSCDDVTADALMIVDDALAMRQALACCLSDDMVQVPCGPDFIPGLWTPINSGGCAGGTLQVTVNVGGVCCPQE